MSFAWLKDSCVAMVPDVFRSLQGVQRGARHDAAYLVREARKYVLDLIIHVDLDDVFMVRTPQIRQEFVTFLNAKKWKIEVKGPFSAGEKFLYLKTVQITVEHCDIRCDRKQYYGMEKELDLFCKADRKTPMTKKMKTKDIGHRGWLATLRASVNSVAGSLIEDVEKEGADYGPFGVWPHGTWWVPGWMALVLRAVIGALSALQWLRTLLLQALSFREDTFEMAKICQTIFFLTGSQFF